jgi:hypothetical protein
MGICRESSWELHSEQQSSVQKNSRAGNYLLPIFRISDCVGKILFIQLIGYAPVTHFERLVIEFGGSRYRQKSFLRRV